MKSPTVVVFCGVPMSGKTSIAQIVQARLKSKIEDENRRAIEWHILDSDSIALATMGELVPGRRDGGEGHTLNNRRMVCTYALGHEAIRLRLYFGISTIVTYTYVTASSWKFFADAVQAGHPEAVVRVIQCRAIDDTHQEVERRMIERRASAYPGGTTTAEEYFQLRDRIQPPPMEHLVLHTWNRNTVEDCAEEALRYILG